MEYRPGWVFPTPDPMYTLTQSHSPFSSNVSSYFRRPAKVVKPSSRNTSPKHLGRRRTATMNALVGRTKSVMEKQRASMQQQMASRQSRPVSWHPNTYPDFTFATHNQSYFIDANDACQQPSFYGTATVNGLYTPLSQAVVDEPQIQELITPLEGLSAQEMGQQYDELFDYQYWLPQDTARQQQYAMDNMFPQAVQQPSWQWNASFGQDLPTAPSSPNFLPIQGAIEASPLDLNTRILPTKTEGDELVAMGLYDSPAEVQSSTFLFSGTGRKRSLKLEESFVPAAESEKDEDEDEDEDAEGENEEEDENQDGGEGPISFPEFPADHSTSQSASLAGQSFFFDREPVVSSQAQAVYPPGMGDLNGGLFNNQGMGYGWF